jgi:membrane-associated protease RseP (regulator of RpoE activity)
MLRVVLGYAVLAGAICWACAAEPAFAKPEYRMMKEEALRLGQEFGVVGEVDEEIRDMLGLQRAEGVVVFEVIAGRPAELAGIKVKSIIKEIDKVEIKTLEDFGRALETAMPTENFSVATYEPTDPDNQGLAGGINFHFVRIAKD